MLPASPLPDVAAPKEPAAWRLRRFANRQNNQLPERLLLAFFAALVLLSCLLRYLQFPSFWLDEAWIAVPLREPSPQTIFARLHQGLYFPRLYLSLIAAVRQVFGYEIWSLRLLPTLCFVAATILWLRLLAKRAGVWTALKLLGGALLLGSTFWLEQSIQLKQYTFDVLLALLPFVVGDKVFADAFADGKSRIKIALLALPCALSYTYPLALFARVAGWYLDYAKRRTWRVDGLSVGLFVIAVLLALVSIWFTDHRHNLQDHNTYLNYWNHCILRVTDNPLVSLRTIGNFLWGWHHGRLLPLVVVAVAPLQALGLYRVLKRWWTKTAEEVAGRTIGEGAAGVEAAWGSRSLGALCLLLGMLAASALVNYPLCTGRVTLFTQIHTQIFILEGAVFVVTWLREKRFAHWLLYASILVVCAYSTHRYAEFVQQEPPENLRPVLPLLDPSVADTLWVHPCSVAQVRSLPDPLPIPQVITRTRRALPQPGEKMWVIWSHLSDGLCKDELAELRARAVGWQVVHESPGRGLALAEF